MKKNIMRVAIAMMSATMIMGAFTGCGKSTSNGSGNSENTATEVVKKDFADYVGFYTEDYTSSSIVSSFAGGTVVEILKYDGAKMSAMISQYEGGSYGGKVILKLYDIEVNDNKVTFDNVQDNNQNSYSGEFTLEGDDMILTVKATTRSEYGGSISEYDNHRLCFDTSEVKSEDGKTTVVNNKFKVPAKFSITDMYTSIFQSAPYTVATDEHFFYTVYEDKVCVYYIGGLGDTVVYPSEYEGKPVRAIGMNPAYDSELDAAKKPTADVLSQVKNVVIPETVWDLGREAFENMSITSIDIPKNVVAMGPLTFKNCGSITEITIPKNVFRISYEMFPGCDNLTTVNKYNTYTDISKDAFMHCASGITSFTYIK